MRVALVHDYFTQLGGAERVVGRLHEILEPEIVAASVVDRRLLPPALADLAIRSTWLQPLLRAGAPLASMAPLLPAAFASLRLDGVDLLVSSTSAFAHHVRAPRGARHLAYVHTPARFIWQTDEYFREHRSQERALRPALAWFRRADRAAMARVDRLVANSAHTAARLRRIHGREAVVIHPPIDAAAFQPGDERSGRFLIVARLRPYKRLDLAIEAAARIGAGLDIIGNGPDLGRLRRLSGPGVRFLGHLPDLEVARAMAACDGLVVPGGEDFGLTMAEVQAAGRPPIALAAGGALEIVEDGRTGFLAPAQTVDAFATAMLRAREVPLEVDELAAAARRFDVPVFAAAMRAVIAETAGSGGIAG
ncbi:MAG: glycosyltransferase [Chloroflexi bacterium]|nr:glycosyltransferase [Chloroflexota bacterium]